MKLVFTGTYEIDIEAEKKRIKKCFKGDTRVRQMALLDLFAEGKLQEWCQTYNALPYNEESECSEKEFVGLYSDILRDFQYARYTLESVRVEK